MNGLAICAARVGIALMMLVPQQASQERVDIYKARFAGESNPVRKAKIIEKLGDYQIELMRQKVDDGDLDDAAQTLADYRDECVTAHQSLKATVKDPERRPFGFKELELSVRENLNRLREVLSGVPKDEQQRFLKIRSDLEELNRQLILELFPRQSKPNGKNGTQ